MYRNNHTAMLLFIRGDNVNKETADRLFEYRKINGFSQEEVAAKIGVSRQAISKWERGESSPDTDNLIALAQLYKITIDELINGKNEPKKAENSDTDNTAYQYQKEQETENTQNDTDAKSKTENVSFKNGIHIHDGKDTVDIDFSGIHVENKNGESVHVGLNGIQVDGIDDKHIFQRGKKDSKKEKLFHALFPLCVIIAYLILGFTFEQGWALGWLLLFVIPIVESMISAIKTKNPSAFAYPVLVAGIYLTIGMLERVWHPTWIMFLTIPVYYIISDFFKPDKKI